jgi:hypothetical protein
MVLKRSLHIGFLVTVECDGYVDWHVVATDIAAVALYFEEGCRS